MQKKKIVTKGKGLKKETVRKEPERMYADGLLDREDRSGAGAAFYYKVKS